MTAPESTSSRRSPLIAFTAIGWVALGFWSLAAATGGSTSPSSRSLP